VNCLRLGLCLRLVWLGGQSGQERGVHGAAVKLCEAKIAIEADAGCEGLAGCGIERLRQFFTPLSNPPVAQFRATQDFPVLPAQHPSPQGCRSKKFAAKKETEN
jgi:hypothetical protein